MKEDGRYVIFRGSDRGAVDGHTGTIAFERSLSLRDVRESHALLAYAMNGEALPVQHGFPLRLIVPSWYAVASVKWLSEIEVVDQPFEGYYQTEKYQFERGVNGHVHREPVTLQRVRSLITEPAEEAHVEVGKFPVRGLAWSGAAPIARVEVSLDDEPWQEARLLGEPKRHSWQWWELITRINRPGSHVIQARATDLSGRVQPESPEWNRLGYCNNATQKVKIAVH